MSLVERPAGTKKLYSLEEDVLIVTILQKNKGATIDSIAATMKKCGYDRSSGSVRYRVDRQLTKVDKFIDLHKSATEEDIKKAKVNAEQLLAKVK